MENKQDNEKKVQQHRIAPDARVHFADSTAVAASKYEIKLFFGFSLPQAGLQPSLPDIIYHTVISLSPQLAKALVKSLQRAVDDYEKEHMPLPIKDDK